MLVAFHSPPAEAYNGVLLSYPLVNPVTIDGKWTDPQEWSDASQIRVTKGGKSAGVDVRISLKHDESKLYVLVDFISDTSVNDVGRSNPDMATLFLDPLGNGGDSIQQDDIVIEATWKSNTTAALSFLTYGKGQGPSYWLINAATMHEDSPPEGMQAASSSDPSNDQFASSPHAIYEFCVPRSLFGGPSDPAIAVHVQDHVAVAPDDWKQTINVDYPYGSGYSGGGPNSYARVQFLKAPRSWAYDALSSLNTVQVDGKWTTSDEWSDAVEEALVCVQGDGQAIMKAKFDAKFLYILADFTSDNTTDYNPSSGDPSGVYLSIDAHGDDGQLPKTDDYMIDFHWKTDKPELKVSQGTGSGWSQSKVADPNLFLAASQFDGSNDPYSQRPHAVYEFAIGRSLIGNSTKVGIRLSVWDRGSGTNLHWPPMRTFPSEGGLIKIVPPSLTESAESDRVEVLPGKSASLSITLTAFDNFQGVVDLQVSVSGQGITASASPRSVSLLRNSAQRVDITVGADQNANPGTYHLTVSATGEGVSYSLDLTVEVKSAPVTPATVQQTSAHTTALAANTTPAAPLPEQIPGGNTGLALIGVVVVAIVGLVMLARKRMRSQESR